MLDGAGRSISASLAILNRGWVFRVTMVLIVELQRWVFKSLVLVRARVRIMLYFLNLLLLSLVMGLVGVASNPAPYFAALGLAVAAGVGCGALVGHGGSLVGLILFLIYLGGMLVVFAYSAALAAEPFPETWGAGSVKVYVLIYLLGVGVAVW
ncbi:hypothetical protein PDJAM_G00260610 [Pangasius djambal]|nr:hypothetical protein [Pangasius djambal]